MAGGGIWAKVHKWLPLVMALQILFWFASGLFFAVFPIMDWRGREDFNTPLLTVATALALAMSIAGMVLLPSRLGFTAWLRRRRARDALSPAGRG